MSLTPTIIAEVQKAGHYGNCVATTLFVYDYLLTIRDEKRLVWDAEWSWGKGLYLLIRYSGFPVMIGYCWSEFTDSATPLSCSVIIIMDMGSILTIMHCSGLVLALRTWAIWDRNRLCSIVVVTAWVSVTIVSTVFLVFSTLGLIADGNPIFNADHQFASSGCIPIDTPSTASAALRVFICFATYEGVIFLLTIGRGMKYFIGSKPSLLMMTLYRDAFLASTCLLVMTITSSILYSQFSPYATTTYLIGGAFYFIVPCRIMLNLRDATRSYVDGWDLETTAVTGPRVERATIDYMDNSSRA